MTRFLLSFLLFAVNSLTATAQTATLRSGEHGSFTRLTLRLPLATDWSVVKNSETIDIQLEPSPKQIDLTNLYQRIGRDRVVAVEEKPDATGLTIKLGCNCGFAAFLVDDSLLVIDIGEDLPRRSRNFFSSEKLLSRVNDGVTLQRLELPLLRAEIKGSPATNKFRSILMQTYENASLDHKDQSEVSDFEDNPFGGERTVAIDQSIRSQIKDAVDQGILLPLDPSELPLHLGRELLVEALDEANIRMRLATESDQVSETENKRICPTKEALDLPNWGHVDGFTAGLSYWRQKLIREFDRVDSEAILGLTRHYLHYGFGKEALDIIELASEPDPVFDLLASVARTIDLGHDPEGGVIQNVYHCGGPATLWAILSTKNLGGLADIDAHDFRFSFEELPQHLRDHLISVFADRLLKVGDRNMVEELLSSGPLAPDHSSPAVEMVKAQLYQERGKANEAKSSLENIVEAGTDLSPAALVALTNAQVAAEAQVDAEQVELLAAYAFEHRHTDLANALARAHILSLAHAGRFTEALGHLETKPTRHPETAENDTRALIMKRLASHASDIEFLTAAVGNLTPRLPPEVGNSIATRLLSLGFPELSLDYLSQSADNEFGRERRILRAKSALAVGDHQVAEAELLGLSGEDIDLLRNIARQGGSNAQFSPEEVSDDNMNQLTSLITDPTTYSINDSLISQGESGFLTQAKNMIDQSQVTRASILNIKSRYKIEAE